MNLDVTFRNLTARPEIRRRAEGLHAKLDRFLDEAAKSQLVVAIEHDEAIVELVIQNLGGTYRAEHTDPDLRTALDLVFHTVEHQLRRAKDKRSDVRDRGQAADGFVVGGAADDDEDEDLSDLPTVDATASE